AWTPSRTAGPASRRSGTDGAGHAAASFSARAPTARLARSAPPGATRSSTELSRFHLRAEAADALLGEPVRSWSLHALLDSLAQNLRQGVQKPVDLALGDDQGWDEPQRPLHRAVDQ